MSTEKLKNWPQYLGKYDHMSNSCHISTQTWEWTKKAIFSLLDLTILTSHGSKLSHQQFRQTLVRELI